MPTYYAHIVGWGMYVPPKVVSNDDLAKIVDTSDEWIRSRTGIQERCIATEKDSTASMAVFAAKEALDRARILPSSVDLVIVATLTPEQPMPATANVVQDAIGAKGAGAFDLNAGCTGFIYALSIASGMIESGRAKVAVVIGAETLSRVVDWGDRNTCVLFGDGAGAVILQSSEDPGGVMTTILGSDGAGADHLIIPAGGSKMPASIQTIAEGQHYVKMSGSEVFRFATRIMGRAAKEACDQAGVPLIDINLFIPHQANARIIKSAAKYLKLDSDKVYENLQRYGNTSAASIPLALCEAIAEGRVKNNDHLILVGFGAGLTWGASVVRWGLPVPYQKRQKWYRGLGQAYYRWANFISKIGWLLRVFEDRLAKRTLPPLEEEKPPQEESPDRADEVPFREPPHSTRSTRNTNGRNRSEADGEAVSHSEAEKIAEKNHSPR